MSDLNFIETELTLIPDANINNPMQIVIHLKSSGSIKVVVIW